MSRNDMSNKWVSGSEKDSWWKLANPLHHYEFQPPPNFTGRWNGNDYKRGIRDPQCPGLRSSDLVLEAIGRIPPDDDTE